ncbi:MAG: TIGR00153 family protein [Gammaproteobacteria bacterium]|nr:TIGR00153 family protein [Gammaproteobacteria bacterium]
MATTYVQRIFGRSPFKPIQAHIDICHACAELVPALLENVAAENWDEVAHLQQQIVVLENEADDLKTEIRSRLPRGFFLPVSRPDLLDLLTRQDRIANRAKGIAGLILGRRLTFPPALNADIDEFARECVKACLQARQVVRELDELLDTGFRGRETDRVRTMVHDIDVTERRCDEIEAAIRARLYSLEAGLSPVDVVFMYRVIEWIGDLANHAERVGHRLDQLLAS